MFTTRRLFISIIISFWLLLLPVLSIQNITPVSLKFLVFESISLPVGVLLSFTVAFGFIVGSFLPLFPEKKQKRPRKNRAFAQKQDSEKDPIFDWE
ncbi:MAG: lipopolysaccharide assembly protein LapA domain-containing protein [Geminocystis sp.]|nr:lipopolysaccharide assembly protein LapA domain-containing protein [Geminocystis sp.]HIK36910.1 LapA family protein [Geminocystis sp. M7585_C2015_104]MCS7148554.1 lipopolysaccharide assembly protein LapA domain-containing protein [Geminocystis sp.]MCX8079510.1 lipopolysaccharide assembly protein LapA domain-containing protein [Geminocystis sp.]MDW8114873.1 LapA family protein [Geminocystis sp.]